MKLTKCISIIGTVIFLFINTNQVLVAQQTSAKHIPEVWYMGMNDPDKPLLFMKSFGGGRYCFSAAWWFWCRAQLLA